MVRSVVALLIGVLLFNINIVQGQEWAKTYGGSGNESAKSIIITSDGGYIVSGLTVTYGAGSTDAWVVKIDSNGVIQWQKAFGGPYEDSGIDIQLKQ